MESTKSKPRETVSIKYISIGTIGTAFLAALIFYGIQGEKKSSMKSQDLYSVVFDAGSTGSRMFAFHFKLIQKGGIDGERVLLENEVFEHIEPGISYYSLNPSEAADSLSPLLKKAVASVPTSCQNSTLITLKATAGLRLLPKEKGDSIIEEVKELMKKSPFFLPDPSKIMIMKGEEEGLFGWITVNFLLDGLWHDDSASTVATIDLGGGSMQVTFELSDNANMSNVKVNHLYKLRLLHKQFLVFTHSYLGSGLMSGRLGIMGIGEGDLANADQGQNERGILRSPCFPSGFNTTWKHGEHTYLVMGTSLGSSLKLCHLAVSKWVDIVHLIKNEQFDKKELHFFSYFHDVARWANLIRPTDFHKVMKPSNFFGAAQHYCDPENNLESRPFLCMDLLYLYSMLTDGFGLDLNREIHVVKKIDGHEVSWSLGAALSTLSKQFSYSSLYL